MNAYLVIEDGGDMVWIAPTMQRALELAWDAHVANNIDPDDLGSVDDAREQYEHEILQSCTPLGEVANP